MALIESSRHDPPPSGLAWALKPKDVSQVLGDVSGVVVRFQAGYLARYHPSVILAAQWYPSRAAVHGSIVQDERVVVSVGAVPADARRDEVRLKLRTEALTGTLAWIRRAETSAEGWRMLQHSLVWLLSHGQVERQELDAPPVSRTHGFSCRPGGMTPTWPPFPAHSGRA
jgi:hypothetical protein